MMRSSIVRWLTILIVAIIAFTLLMPAPAEAATGKRIVVMLSQRRLYAYKGNTVVASMAVNARGTARGNFRVQNKIPLAHSIIRNWRLPYWMGIYYVRGVQNGIHGPEIIGRLTAYNSLGCVVIMSRANAGWLFSWAPVGTPVQIR